MADLRDVTCRADCDALRDAIHMLDDSGALRECASTDDGAHALAHLDSVRNDNVKK